LLKLYTELNLLNALNSNAVNLVKFIKTDHVTSDNHKNICMITSFAYTVVSFG